MRKFTRFIFITRFSARHYVCSTAAGFIDRSGAESSPEGWKDTGRLYATTPRRSEGVLVMEPDEDVLPGRCPYRQCGVRASVNMRRGPEKIIFFHRSDMYFFLFWSAET